MYLEAKFRLTTGNVVVDGHELVIVLDADGRIVRSDLLSVDSNDSLVTDSAECATSVQQQTLDAIAAALAAWHTGDTDAAKLFATLPVAIEGTEFQAEVAGQLRSIPAGSTLTYTQLASAAGRPAAPRAAARVCSQNKAIFVVPCHRIVPAGGGVGQYARGAALKEALLQVESAR